MIGYKSTWLTELAGLKSIGADCKLFTDAIVLGVEHISIGSHVIIDSGVMLHAVDETMIDDYVHLGFGSSIQGGGRLHMADFSGISAGVRLFTGNDDYLGSALTNPTVPAEFRAVSRSFIHIGKHCIIGANSVVLPGVTIGEGAVIGACSLVKHDVEPWTVNVGTPCRPIKKRPKELVLAKERQLRARAGELHKLT